MSADTINAIIDTLLKVYIISVMFAIGKRWARRRSKRRSNARVDEQGVFGQYYYCALGGGGSALFIDQPNAVVVAIVLVAVRQDTRRC